MIIGQGLVSFRNAIFALGVATFLFSNIAGVNAQETPPDQPVEDASPEPEAQPPEEEPFVFTPPTFPSFSLEEASDLVVTVNYDERAGLSRQGVVVGPEHVAAPYHGIRRESDATITVETASGTLFGRLETANEDLDLAIFRVPKVGEAVGVRFAVSLPAAGDRVHYVTTNIAGNQLELSGKLQTSSNVMKSGISINSLISRRQVGGAVFNTCGELIGVMTSDERDSAARGDGPVTSPLTFVNLTTLRSMNGVSLRTADSRCLTPAEQQQFIASEREKALKAHEDKLEAKRLETERIEQAEQAAEEEKQRLEAEKKRAEEAEKLKKDVEESRKQAEKLRRENDELSKQVEEKSEVEKQKEEALSEAEKQLQEKELTLEEKEAARIDAEERAKKNRKWLLYGGIGSGVLLLIIGIVAALLTGRQRQARLAAAEDAEYQRRYAEQLKSRIPPPAVNDALLVGAVSLKLPGNLLPEEAGGVILGRNPANAQVVYDQADISRQHARFFVRGGDTLVEDMNSSNGTYINGRQLTPGETYIIAPGDQLTFGRHSFEFRVL